jgi:hypothetical protein
VTPPAVEHFPPAVERGEAAQAKGWKTRTAVIPIVMTNKPVDTNFCAFVCVLGGGGNTGTGTITCLSDKGGLGSSERHMGHLVT